MNRYEFAQRSICALEHEIEKLSLFIERIVKPEDKKEAFDLIFMASSAITSEIYATDEPKAGGQAWFCRSPKTAVIADRIYDSIKKETSNDL